MRDFKMLFDRMFNSIKRISNLFIEGNTNDGESNEARMVRELKYHLLRQISFRATLVVYSRDLQHN